MARRPTHTRQRGTSLLDAIMALGVAAVGLAAMAPVLVSCTAMVADAQAETRALVLASSRLEQLAAAPFSQDLDTLATVTDERTDFAGWPKPTGGSGLVPRGPATAWLDTPGFTDLADLAGMPTTEAARAGYVRRWSISQAPGSLPARPIVLASFARLVARERAEPPRGSGDPRAGDLWLVTIRAREGR